MVTVFCESFAHIIEGNNNTAMKVLFNKLNKIVLFIKRCEIKKQPRRAAAILQNHVLLCWLNQKIRRRNKIEAWTIREAKHR